MAQDKSALLGILKDELAYLEDGGYGRSVRTPWKPTSIFRDSPSCLNFDDEARPHPCSECWLMDFVPADHKEADMPCHHIPLDEQGRSVADFGNRTQQELEESVGKWLRAAIARLET